MQPESIEFGFLSIFSLITFFVFLILSKYAYKFKNGILLDNDFNKPQSFHKEPVGCVGGVASLFSFVIFLGIFNLLFSEFLYEYFFLSLCLFFIGFLDDLKVKVSPNLRLSLMSISLIFFIFILSIQIKNIDLIFVQFLLKNKFFSVFFTLICILFIVNGSNLIDGFNGLLGINILIINSVLLFINLNNNHFEFSILIIAQMIILICFLLFNFPKAKMFLGDSSSYLLGVLTSLNIINTNNLNSNMSSFFFCILLFYLFFEVFFSFLRKIYQNKSPVLPDDKHLHMLSFKKISKTFGNEQSNYINSLVINLVYSSLVLPSLFFSDNDIVCKYWFFSLLIVYMIIYYRLYYLTKN